MSLPLDADGQGHQLKHLGWWIIQIPICDSSNSKRCNVSCLGTSLTRILESSCGLSAIHASPAPSRGCGALVVLASMSARSHFFCFHALGSILLLEVEDVAAVLASDDALVGVGASLGAIGMMARSLLQTCFLSRRVHSEPAHLVRISISQHCSGPCLLTSRLRFRLLCKW